METKFNVTHIGGRRGTIEFPKDTVFNDSIKRLNIKNIFLSMRYLIHSKIFYKRYTNYLIRKFFN